MRALAPLVITALAFAASAEANWNLDNGASRLSFVTIKAQNVAEVHRFTELAGEVDDYGRAQVVIQLASVDTHIPIRDERMREMLFKTNLFPTATAETRVDMETVEGLGVGESLTVTTELVLNLGGSTLPLSTELLLVRTAANRVLITTLEPLVVNAASVGLSDGVEALRQVAGLPSISEAVPVTFVLQFEDR